MGRSKQKVQTLCPGTEKYLKRMSSMKKPYKNPQVEMRGKLCHLGYGERAARVAKCTLMVIDGKTWFPHIKGKDSRTYAAHRWQSNLHLT